MHQQLIIGDGVYLTRYPQGLELYFRPFRTPGATLSLALFGVACLIPGLFAAIALAPLAVSGPSGMVAIWLMSIFVLPFVAFGVLFVGLAAYRLSNSLTVVVTAAEIRSLRRILGFPVREQRIPHADVTALDAVARRYRWVWNARPLYSIVARTRSSTGPRARPHGRNVTVAESLGGEELMERVRTEIASAARLEHLLERQSR